MSVLHYQLKLTTRIATAQFYYMFIIESSGVGIPWERTLLVPELGAAQTNYNNDGSIGHE